MTAPDPTQRSAPPSYVGLAPMLPVQDVARTIRFYEQLGFLVGSTHVHEGETEPDWAWLHHGHAHLMFSRIARPIEATHQSPSIWLYTADIATAHAELRSRGLEVGEVEHPFYNPGGEFHVHDPDGYPVFVAQAE